MRRYFTDINHLVFGLQARINISPLRRRRDTSEAVIFARRKHLRSFIVGDDAPEDA